MEAEGSFESSVLMCQTVRRHIPNNCLNHITCNCWRSSSNGKRHGHLLVNTVYGDNRS